jgi:phosphoribosylamine-glycine ligase
VIVFANTPRAQVHALTDGHTVQLLPSAQDHKQLLDGDKGTAWAKNIKLVII